MTELGVTLGDFDSTLVIEYAITDTDLTNVYLYLRAMQPRLEPGTWGDIRVGGYYGTSAFLHELIELRILLRRDPYLLTRSDIEVRAFARQPANYDAHLRGLEVEYRYLQGIIRRVLHQEIDIGALLQANAKRQTDWDDLFDTDLPFFEPTAADVHTAEAALMQLRRRGRSE
jgi:hypothetical protein